jgi:hypothetical protein
MAVELDQREATSKTPLLNGNGQRSLHQKALIATPSKSSRSTLPSWLSWKLLVSALVATLAFYFSLGQLGRNQLSELSPFDYKARTERLMSKYGVFDGHNDLVCEYRSRKASASVIIGVLT